MKSINPLLIQGAMASIH